MYTQTFLTQLVHVFRKELRYPLKELLDTQKVYFQLCLDETLRGEASLTGELMDEMAQFRRTFLFLREIQKHFTLQENVGFDVDRECYTPIAGDNSSAKLTSLPGRRVESFHLIGELRELCRCFESDMPFPVKVFLKVCPSIPTTVQMDKEMLVTFLVNAMFQSTSNIKTFPQVWLNTADRVHEIVIVVTKRKGRGRRDTLLVISVVDTGLSNVLTKCGLLAGEGFQSDSSEKLWTDGGYEADEGVNPDSPSFFGAADSGGNSDGIAPCSNIRATVYIQLQEYLFRKAVQAVGGEFKRDSGARVHSSYLNDVTVSLPMHGNGGSTASAPSSASASHITASEYSHYRELCAYHILIFDKLTW